MIATGDEPLQFVLKLASICNLNCSYCYVYNKGDNSWRSRPPFMSVDVIEASIARMRAHAARSGQRKVRIIFHGGEPTLIGAEAFDLICRRLRYALGDIGHVHLSLQTNGTMIDPIWARILKEQAIFVGISIDGGREVHDRARVTHGGRPSYDRIVESLGYLRDAGVAFDLLTVIQPGFDGAQVFRDLSQLRPRSINFLLPDYTHDEIAPVRAEHGVTPCADFLIPAFDEWWSSGEIGVRVGLFWSITRLIMGAESDVDLLGNKPLRFLFVETDGEIQPLDVLRVCGDNFSGTGLNVFTNDFGDLARRDGLLSAAVFGGIPMAGACTSCAERDTCGGGYLPHRYSRAHGFDNPSVWCADLLKLFGHIRARLDVDLDETRARREQLQSLVAA